MTVVYDCTCILGPVFTTVVYDCTCILGPVLTTVVYDCMYIRSCIDDGCL